MSEAVVYGIEALVGLTVVPWCVFVTVSIFGLKQQLALIKQEFHLLQRLEKIVTAMEK